MLLLKPIIFRALLQTKRICNRGHKLLFYIKPKPAIDSFVIENNNIMDKICYSKFNFVIRYSAVFVNI